MMQNIFKKENKSIDYLIISLIVIIFISYVQGYQCKYIKPSICKAPIVNSLFAENGLIENIQSLLLFLSIIILIRIFKIFKTDKLLKIFILLKIFALTYYLGEEISWGQHFFKWNTPEIFNELNNQNETNLHNISNLLDQLPRSLVILWCGFIPLIFYFFGKRFISSDKLNMILLPSLKLLVISFVLLLFFLPDFIVDKMNLHPGHHVDGKDVVEAKYYDLITFNFVERLSEVQELIFCFYFFIYAIALSKFRGNNKI
tara:strand:- start:155 stop:928 length:774 start_codon:yes stop_codon:yes gene_type:complete